MIRGCLLLVSLCLLQFSLNVEGKYFVSCMKMFRPGVPYHVGVTIFDTASVWSTKVSLTNEKTQIDIVSKTQNMAIVSPAKSVFLDFVLDIPAVIDDALYVIKVTSSKPGVTFTNQTLVTLQRKDNMIIIQTDKGIYKPGSTVLFRIFAIDVNLVPVTGQYNIYLKDGKGNRIEQWLNTAADASGVYSGEFDLDLVTPLGDWKIQAEFNNEKEEAIFTVEEYVLPRYEVTISLPGYMLRTDTEVKFKVDAQYTYGEPVEGTAVVSVDIDGTTLSPQIESQKGIKEYTFAIASGSVMKSWSSNLRVNVKFTDTLGGEEREATESVSIYDKKWKADFGDTSDVLRPSLVFIARVKVTEQDGTPPPSPPGAVILGYKFDCWDKKKCSPSVPTGNYVNKTGIVLDSSGDFEADINIPDGATALHLQVYYDNLAIATHTIRETFKTDSMQSIEVSMKEVLATKLTFNVRSTFNMNKVFYQVLSKGEVTSSGSVKPGLSDLKSVDIEIALTGDSIAKMAPKARLVVYALFEMEIIADSIQFDLDGIFKYQTMLDFDEDRKTVGDPMSLKVMTKANAYVGVVAIDQSVLLLKKGNDVSEQAVIDKLDEYYLGEKSGDSEVSPPCRGCMFRKKRSIWFPRYTPGQTDSNKIFETAALVYMTDADIYSESYDGRSHRKIGKSFNDNDFPEAAPAGNDRVLLKQEKPGAKVDTDVRKYFPETWIWENIKARSDGTAYFNGTVPDTITSYVANAFALHSVDGLSVASTPAKLEAFKSFYITPKLLYSIVLGESFTLKCVVYNYLATGTSVSVDVTLDISRGEFTVDGSNTQTISVPNQSGAEVSFDITPTKLKYIQIKIVAEAGIIARDTVVKSLLVKPEGKTIYKNKVFFIDRATSAVNDPPFTTMYTVPFPTADKMVADTKRIKVVTMGDIMGPALTGLESLVRMPYGCGEQNMLSMVPSISVRKYLQSMGALTPEMDEKTKNFMKIGYQRELTYQLADKSFSAFTSDKIGSTWLTTFVLRSFFKVDEMLPGIVDRTVLAGALDFVLDQQQPDGSVPEFGKVCHRDMQGGAASGPTLSAYVMAMLSEVPPSLESTRVTNAITKLKAYLKGKLSEKVITDSNYALALMAYGFEKVGDKATTDTILNDFLLPRAITESGKTYWNPSVESTAQGGGSSSVEITGYIIMIYTERQMISEGLPLVKWLLGMRNEHGGCISTQDTVVGLESLAGYAAMVFRPTNVIDLTADVIMDGVTSTFTIDSTTMQLYQSVAKDNPTSDDVRIQVTGQGTALIQVSYSYNVVPIDVGQAATDFSMKVVAEYNKDKTAVEISACFSNDKDRGMCLMEVDIPSGMAPEAPHTGTYDKYENEGDRVVLYFNEVLKDTTTCVSLMARSVTPVANRKQSMAIAYDYYESEDQVTTTFEPTVASRAENSVCRAGTVVFMLISLCVCKIMLSE